jgi:hypothetical protein
MTQPQSQLSQQVSTPVESLTARFAVSMASVRTAAFSLLVDRALSA